MKKTINIQIGKNGWQVSDPQYKSYDRAVIFDGAIMNPPPEMSGCPIATSKEEALEMIGEAVRQYIIGGFKRL